MEEQQYYYHMHCKQTNCCIYSHVFVICHKWKYL